MTSPSCCRGPRGHRAEEKSRGHRREDDSAAAGAGYRGLGICDRHIGTLVGVRHRKTGCRGHHLCKIGAVAYRGATSGRRTSGRPLRRTEMEYRAKSAAGKVRRAFFEGLREDL